MVAIEVPVSSSILNGVVNSCFVLIATPLWGQLLQVGHNKSDTSELLLTGHLELGRGVKFCRLRVDLCRSWRKLVLLFAVLSFIAVELMLGFVFIGFSKNIARSVQGIASVPRNRGDYSSKEKQSPCTRFQNGQFDVSFPVLLPDSRQNCESRPLIRGVLTKDQRPMTPVTNRSANGTTEVAMRGWLSYEDGANLTQIYLGKAESTFVEYIVACIYVPTVEVAFCHCMYKYDGFLHADLSVIRNISAFTRPNTIHMRTSRLKFESEYAGAITEFYKGVSSTLSAKEVDGFLLLGALKILLTVHNLFYFDTVSKLRDNFESFVNEFFKFGEREIWTLVEKQVTRVSEVWGIATLCCLSFSLLCIVAVLLNSRHNRRYMRDVSQENAQVMTSLILNTLTYGKCHNRELLNPELVIQPRGNENHISLERERGNGLCRRVDTRKLLSAPGVQGAQDI
jgi:hypothetical protein